MTTEKIQNITDKLFQKPLNEEFDSDAFMKYVTLDAPENIDNLVNDYNDEFKECLIKSADSSIFVDSIARDENENVDFEFSDDIIKIYFHCKRVGEFE
jgi:hypothetical protein